MSDKKRSFEGLNGPEENGAMKELKKGGSMASNMDGATATTSALALSTMDSSMDSLIDKYGPPMGVQAEKCEHGKIEYVCKDCHGAGVCGLHNEVKWECQECTLVCQVCNLMICMSKDSRHAPLRCFGSTRPNQIDIYIMTCIKVYICHDICVGACKCVCVHI